MTPLTKYEKETIVLTSEGDDIYNIYTFNPGMKRKLEDFARRYPDHCRQTASTKEGSVTYEVSKSRVSIRLVPPYSEERRKAAQERAKQMNADKSSQD